MSRRSGAGYKPVKNCISVTPSGCGVSHNYFTRIEVVSLTVASWKRNQSSLEGLWQGKLTAFSLYCALCTAVVSVGTCAVTVSVDTCVITVSVGT